MKTAQSDSVFKLSERRFYAPPGIIKGFNTFSGEFIPGKVGYNTFICGVVYGKSYNTEIYFIGVMASIFNIIKVCCFINKTDISAGSYRNFFEWLRTKVTLTSISKDSSSGKSKLPTRPFEMMSLVRNRKYCLCSKMCAILL